MREILFRGKRIDNGEWLVSGTLLQNSDDERFCWMPVYGDKFGTAEDDKGNILRIEYGTLYRVNPDTVGQYTGLKDKNGKRIFEGDIVRIVERGMVSNGGIVMFENAYPGGWLIGSNKSESKCSLAMRTDVEVIGNIYDNGELMEVR